MSAICDPTIGDPTIRYPALRDPAICDPLVGIVRDCLELALDPGESRVFCVIAEATHPERFARDASACARYGCGVGLSVAQATHAAVGEVLERYCASICDPAQLRHAAYDDLTEDAVAPGRFPLFSARQYAAFAHAAASADRCLPQPFTRRTRTAWVHGFNLTTGRPVLVPAAFVYLPYPYAAGETFIADSFSTGLACGRSRDEAACSALCEVIERDALAVVWHGRLSLPVVRFDREAAFQRLYAERLSCAGTRCEFLDATLDIPIPTIIAHVDVERGGGTILASATHPRPAIAARKALLEAIQSRISWKRELIHGTTRRYAEDFADITRFAEHAELYTSKAMRPHIEFLWSAGVERDIDGLPGWTAGSPSLDLQQCVRLVRDAGFEVIAIDVTTRDVGRAGYRVVRVIVPGLQPLHARQDAPFLGGERLLTLPHALGRRPQALDESELNRFVHPFP